MKHDSAERLDENGPLPIWRTLTGGITVALLGIGGVLLVIDHRTHVLGVLPYLILAACPLMHLFHHGRHRRHRDADNNDERRESSSMSSGDSR